MCCHRTHARVLRPAISDQSSPHARVNRAIGVFDEEVARL